MAREGWKCLERASSLPTGKEIKGGSNWPARNFWSYPEKLAASGLDAELRPESSAIIGAGRGGAGPGRGAGPGPAAPPPFPSSAAQRPRRVFPGRDWLAGRVAGRASSVSAGPVSVFRLPPSAWSRVGVPWTGTARGCLLPLLPIKNKATVSL